MDIPSQVIGQLGPYAALVLLVVAVGLGFIRGAIVPRSALDDARADRDGWKEAYLAEHAIAAELAHQNDELLEISRTSSAAIRSLPAAVDRAGRRR